MERRDYQKELRANIEHYVRNASTENLSEDEVQAETEGLYNLVRDIALESFKNGKAAGLKQAKAVKK